MIPSVSTCPCNATDEEEGGTIVIILSYFNNDIHHNGGTRWLSKSDTPEIKRIIPDDYFEDDIVWLLQLNHH